jgi:hypothetical protein
VATHLPPYMVRSRWYMASSASLLSTISTNPKPLGRPETAAGGGGGGSRRGWHVRRRRSTCSKAGGAAVGPWGATKEPFETGHRNGLSSGVSLVKLALQAMLAGVSLDTEPEVETCTCCKGNKRR